MADDDFIFQSQIRVIDFGSFDFEKRDVVILQGEMPVELRSSDGDWLSLAEHHNAYSLPFTNTETLSVSKSDGSLFKENIPYCWKDVILLIICFGKGTEITMSHQRRSLFMTKKRETKESVRSTIYELGFSQD